jgi:CBS domain containing-hemolysin-like protein
LESESFLIKFFLFIILFVLLSLFFGIETAYYSLSEKDLKQLRRKATKSSLRLVKLLSNPKPFFLAIKIGLFVTNIATIIVGIILVQDLARIIGFDKEVPTLLIALLMLSVLIVLSELLSRLFVLKYNQATASLASLPLHLYCTLMAPITNTLSKFISFLSSKLGITHNNIFVSQQKILGLVQDTEKIENLEAKERAMIHSIFELSETEVHEIMVPRTDMVCVEENARLKDLTKLIKEKGHTRIPLYSEQIDNILGIIHAKDLLPYLLLGSSDKVNLRSLARPAYFVPESKKLHHLLKEFQQEKSHMAIVVDEYGGTAGLVTLEDVIEEIVGDIQDEYDQELPLYRKLDEKTFLVDAKIDLHDLNEELEINLPTEGEYESLGGFILQLTGYVPHQHEIVKYDGYTFQVEKVDRNRILLVKLSINLPQLDESDNPDVKNEEP